METTLSTIAAIQATPCFMDLKASVQKACDLITDAARKNAKLVLFPEAFLPGYPDWIWVVPAGKGAMMKELHREMLEQSITIGDEHTQKLAKAAKQAKCTVAIGINERNGTTNGGSLFNTLLYISHEGEILGKHRKLVPTGGERMIWAQGDGSTLEAFDTPIGRIGGLICWENYMPLARYAMYASGVEIYLAPTWDYGDPWIATLHHIAREGRVFVIGCATVQKVSDIPDRFEFKSMYPPTKEWVNPGLSVIVGPNGKNLAGPVEKQEEILLASFDRGLLNATKWDLDVCGHYARPDVFDLRIDRAERPITRS